MKDYAEFIEYLYEAEKNMKSIKIYKYLIYNQLCIKV